MPLSANATRAQLRLVQPLLRSCTLDTLRRGQNMIGELMEAKFRRQVKVETDAPGAWIIPGDERRQGVLLYLHGGGYTCGDLEYAKGFGAMLAVQCGIRVFCAAYRLAPEAPFPAAAEDALAAYEYLLNKGYRPEQITLCGESAGGGLCYSVCLQLREKEMPMPNGIIAISPWVDLTCSGESHKANGEKDAALSPEMLEFFADCYASEKEAPLVSPLFGQLEGMPPSLIFAGDEEILLSDAQRLQEKLLRSGCKSRLSIRPQRWHAYLLYGIGEDQQDFALINRFLNRFAGQEQKLRWMRLDNAAKIYPAARTSRWSNVFRLSATLTEEVDAAVLQEALDVTVRRFPSIGARLRKGAFWYYLQQIPKAPRILEESCTPLERMSRQEMRKCALRVIVYRRRIAVEFFHSLTDGSGGMIFLKTLVAEYLHQKHGLQIPPRLGVLDRLEEPSEAELEDSFQKYAGTVSASRQGTDAWRLSGTPEKDNMLNLVCLRLPVRQVLDKAHEFGATLTEFLCAAMMMALQNLQKRKVHNIKKRKAIKVQIPVNLRSLFPSTTVRNFALYTTPELDPRLGEYTFEEICKTVRHHVGLNVTEKKMRMMIAANVSSERIMAVRLMPLFLKNIVMHAIFMSVGEKQSCLSLYNLGRVTLPEEMVPYVERFDFILGVQASAPHNCGVLSYGDTLYINMIRDIRESELEYEFYRVLRDLGLSAEVQSNRTLS